MRNYAFAAKKRWINYSCIRGKKTYTSVIHKLAIRLGKTGKRWINYSCIRGKETYTWVVHHLIFITWLWYRHLATE